MISKQMLKKDSYLKQNFLSEIKILKSVDNPHVIKLFNVFEDNQFYYEFFEFCNAGDLRYILK